MQTSKPYQYFEDAHYGYSNRHQIEKTLFVRSLSIVRMEEWKTWKDSYDPKVFQKVLIDNKPYRYKTKDNPVSDNLLDQLSYSFFVRALDFENTENHIIRVLADGKEQDLHIKVKSDDDQKDSEGLPLIKLESRSDFEGVVGKKDWVAEIWINPRASNRMESFQMKMGGVVGTLKGRLKSK